MSESLLAVRGSPGSPYTRKMLALLRFRRIPYRYIQYGWDDAGLPQPKVQLLPVFYFENDAGELDAEVDSTPIIRRLEDEYGGRSVIPTDPASAFLNYLVEDYGDEWLTKAMFHYRWYYEADIDMAGSVLPHYADVTQDDETIAQLKKIFSERQISRLYVVGSNDTTASVIEDSYKRFLDCLNEHLKTYPFIVWGIAPDRRTSPASGSSPSSCSSIRHRPASPQRAFPGCTPGSVRWRTYRVSRSRTTPSSTRTRCHLHSRHCSVKSGAPTCR